MRTPIRRLLATAGATVLLTTGVAAAAQADEDDWTITRYAVVAEVGPDGGAQVTVDLDFDFGPDDDAHGPYLSLVERQEIEGDPDRYRVTEVGDIAVTSSTGAPTDLQVEREDGGVVVRVGDEDVEIGGVQSYTVSYRLDSLATPAQGGAADDAIVWNAVGLGWEVPMENVSVTLVAPGEATSLKCVAGGVGSTTPCERSATTGDPGGGATVTQDRLEPGQGLTVAARYPAGTFPDAEVAYAPRRTFGNTFGVTPATGTVGGAALVGGVGALLLARHRRRDADGVPAGAATGVVATDLPEGFATEPPADVPPGEFGTLIDERAQTHDVVAVLLDLAVRGVVHIEVVPGDGDGDADGAATDASEPEPISSEPVDPENLDFELIRVAGPHDLRDYERALVDGIFGGTRDTVRVSERSTEIAAAIAAAQIGLDDAVTTQGWFAGSPRRVRTRWLLGGLGLVVAGLAAAVVLALTIGWGLVGLAIVVLGVVTMGLSSAMPTRTPRGSELTRQAHAFERYLRDVTSDAPAWPQGRERLVPSVFETYLPYAVALQLEERWTQAFAGALERGELTQPDWYLTPASPVYLGLWSSGAFSSSIGQVTAGFAATTTPPASTGGGSGYSPSVGGGVGGGGGGGW